LCHREHSASLTQRRTSSNPRGATIEWLAGKHGVPISAYTVSMVRFGAERLLAVRREPAQNGDPAADVQWMLSGGVPVGAGAVPPVLQSTAASTPPPA